MQSICLLLTLVFTVASLCGMQNPLAHDIYAVITEPVIEMHNSFAPPDTLPASPETKSCPRAHQALFNEIARIEDWRDNHVKISFAHVIYGYNGETGEVSNTFWMAKKHCKPLHTLTPELRSAIPESMYGKKPTVILTYPWNGFSMGTRFCHRCADDTDDHYAIVYIDYLCNEVCADYVPHTHAIEEKERSASEKRALLGALLNNLIDRVASEHPGNIIPYIWGGSSFIEPYQDEEFYLDDGVWQRTGNRHPYTGYDCSEFVMRMAQIAGFDFPWKTTTAIKQGLKEIEDDDPLQEGDLIWVPGHVAFVSAIHENELIEARGYASGFGCVHRTTIGDYVEGISTYDELRARSALGKTIRFKDTQGRVLAKEHKVTLLKIGL